MTALQQFVEDFPSSAVVRVVALFIVGRIFVAAIRAFVRLRCAPMKSGMR